MILLLLKDPESGDRKLFVGISERTLKGLETMGVSIPFAGSGIDDLLNLSPGAMLGLGLIDKSGGANMPYDLGGPRHAWKNHICMLVDKEDAHDLRTTDCVFQNSANAYGVRVTLFYAPEEDGLMQRFDDITGGGASVNPNCIVAQHRQGRNYKYKDLN